MWENLARRLGGSWSRWNMVLRGDRYRDSAYYSIVDEEWPEVKENLRRRLAR